MSMMFSRASAPPRWGVPATRRLAAGRVLGLVALATGFAASRAPLLSLFGALGTVLVGLALSRFPLAIGILTASFFFDTYLASGGTKILTPGQSLGVLVALAWGLEWLLGR